MFTLTSHLLNGVNGTHATGVNVSILDKHGIEISNALTNNAGRIELQINTKLGPDTNYFHYKIASSAYFHKFIADLHSHSFLETILIPFIVPSKGTKIHIPVIFSPNTYTVWYSVS